MQHFRTSFGFDTISVGDGGITIHTCKVRLKIAKIPKLAAPIRVIVNVYRTGDTIHFEFVMK